ncbi:MAG: hypothetical protein ACI8X5_003895 [Planctomycetota bacterium]|jgi:hypothetical protein
MKKTIGNFALLVGVIVSSIAAAESQRISRVAAVDTTLVGEVLHGREESNYATTYPDNYVYLDSLIDAGKVLDAADLAWLRTQGLEKVLVQRQAQDSELLKVDPALVGHVFAGPVLLPSEIETIQPGRKISKSFVSRLGASELTQILIQVQVLAAKGQGASTKETIEWSLLPEAENLEGSNLIGSTLREEVSLPIQLKAKSYIDDAVLARLQNSEIGEVRVKIPRTFTWRAWKSRWIFVIGIAITLLGVFLKSSKLDAAALEERELEVAHVGALLRELESKVEALANRADEMDAKAIHREVDPLLTGPIFQIVEARNSIRTAHGSRVFASVMDSFSRGERRLNRAWSAAVDDYVHEARRCLASALIPLREAREALPGAHSATPPGFDTNDATSPLPPDVALPHPDGHWTDE